MNNRINIDEVLYNKLCQEAKEYGYTVKETLEMIIAFYYSYKLGNNMDDEFMDYLGYLEQERHNR